MDSSSTSAGTPFMFRTPHLASIKTEEKFMFLIYELFLGLSRGEETFVFGKCYGFTHDHPWIEPPRRSFFPPSFSNIALLPLVARTLEMAYEHKFLLTTQVFYSCLVEFLLHGVFPVMIGDSMALCRC
jgi:hypothetical protein